ncbi:MAG: hypothetical protein HOV81_14320 [Kofleriaceae bacterium]|nr:hypothetical protein [Kofleriaceae bacterium]
MRRLVGLCALALAGPAAASPIEEPKPTRSDTVFPSGAEVELGLQQLQLERRRDLADDEAVDPWFRFAGFAQVTGGGRSGGDLAAGAAAAIGGAGCDLVSGSVVGRLRPTGDDQHATGEATYGVCLIRYFFTLAFDGTRATGIAPALAARRSLWTRRYSAVYDRFELGFGEMWKPGSSHRHTIFSMSLGHGTTTQTDSLDTRTTKTIDLDFSLYRYRNIDSGLSVDAIVFVGNSLKAGMDNKGGVASTFMPARVRLDRPAYYVAAGAGWGMTGGQVTASGSTEVDGKTVSSWSETIDSEGLPQITRIVGDLEAGIRRDRLTASARIARAFYPTFDGNIAREGRVEGEVTYVAGRTRRTTLSLAPFATRTRTWTREDGTSREVAAGASLQFGRALTKELRVDAIGEAGVSPYARLDRERTPTGNSVGGQVVVALSGRITEQHDALKKLLR